MGWSTRDLALLGGTTLRAVRHYHAIGLLDEPERQANGYKMYRTEHLVRLVEIRRLTALGLSLKQIADIDDSSVQDHAAALDDADAALRESIERLEAARAELAEFRLHLAPADLPPRLSGAAQDARLTASDRALYAVLAQLYGEGSVEYLGRLMQDAVNDPVTEEFNALTDSADEATRERIARHFAEGVGPAMIENPRPDGLVPRRLEQRNVTALADVISDLYSPVQIDVFERMWRILGVD